MSIFQREQYEERQYPVSGRNLRGYKGSFERAGYPVQVTPSSAPGIYIMIVSLPASMPQEIDPYSLPPRRQVWPAFDARRFATVALSLLIAGCIGYLAYTMFAPKPLTLAGLPVEVGGMAIRQPDPTPAAGSENGPLAGLLAGIRWPWASVQDAAAQVQQTSETLNAILTALLWLGGLLLVLVVLWFARGFVGTVIAAAQQAIGNKGGES